MRRGRLVAGMVVTVAVVSITALLVQILHSDQSDVTTADQHDSDLKWKIHDATRTTLPADGYTLFFQESQKCNGAAVIKYTGEDWRLGLAWYDHKSETITDVVKRDELFELLGRYVEVDRVGLKGVRPAKEDKTPEMYVGTIHTSSESVWLRLDPDSCGVRSGWLVYREVPDGKVTRQKISW